MASSKQSRPVDLIRFGKPNRHLKNRNSSMAGQQVFLSYARENEAEADRLRTDLLAAGYKVWWDRLIEPDQDPYFEVRNAMDRSRVLLVCLSREAVSKTQSGIYREARDVVDLYPTYQPGAIVVLPVRFSECAIPSFSTDETRTLDLLEYVDLFPAEQWSRGLTLMQARLRRTFSTAPEEPLDRPPGGLVEQRIVRARRVETQHEITQILNQANQADTVALNRLWALVYEDLRQIAHREMHGERQGHVLSTTALVSEAYIKLADQKHITWRNRKHFYALSCEVMRHVLIDHARRRDAQKREGQKYQVPLEEALQMAVNRPERLIDLDEALKRLAVLDPRLAKVVECKFFGGFTIEETAEALGMATRTVERDWQRARAYLYKMLNPKPNNT